MIAGGLKSEFPSHVRTIVQALEQPSARNIKELNEIARLAKKDSPDLARIAWGLQNILQTNGNRGKIIGANRFAPKAPKSHSKAEGVAHALLALQKINPGLAGEVAAALFKGWVGKGAVKIEGLYVDRKA